MTHGRTLPPLVASAIFMALLACGPEPAGTPPASQSAAHAGLTAEQQRIKEQLEAIGYAAATEPAPAERGVVLHHPQATAPGLTLFTSGHAPAAALIDEDGEPVHRWRYSFQRVWPDAKPHVGGKGIDRWRYAHALPNGDLLAIFEGRGLIRLDRQSNLLWAAENGAHHDLEVLPSGDIWVLTREAHMVPRINPDEPVLEDFVTVLDASGRTKDRFSLLEVFERSDLDPAITAEFRPDTDLFHTNTLEVFDGSEAHLSPLFARGNILTSFNRLSVIAIIDPERREIVWATAERWQGVHYPTLLEDGTILFFANGSQRGASTVYVLDPLSGEFRWSYRGSPPESLFSRECGSAQRLANGNVLITESQDGRILEVTADGEIVWEYLNPADLPRRPEKIPYIYFATRYDPAGLPFTGP